MKRAILYLSPDLFVGFTRATKAGDGRVRRFVVKENPLPEDCQCVDVHYRPELDYLVLVLESEEFAEVVSGEDFPVLPKPVYQTVYEDEDAVRRTIEAKIEALTNVFKKAVAFLECRSIVHSHINLTRERQAEEELQQAILAAGKRLPDVKDEMKGGEG